MEKNLIRAILACDDEWGIGKDGDLPWPHNSNDLKWFKKCTDGQTVLMGRNTWDSLPFKPLPNRINAIVTSRDLKEAEDLGCVVADMRSMLKILPQMKNDREVWVIGGAQLIEQMMPYIDQIWLSRIFGKYDCDTFLPEKQIRNDFELTSMYPENDLTIQVWSKK